MTEIISVESKDAVNQQGVERHTKFDQVSSGICPHCGGTFGDQIQTNGRGVKRVCTICEHKLQPVLFLRK